MIPDPLTITQEMRDDEATLRLTLSEHTGAHSASVTVNTIITDAEALPTGSVTLTAEDVTPRNFGGRTVRQWTVS